MHRIGVTLTLMSGILSALRASEFVCYGPAGVDDSDSQVFKDGKDERKPLGKILETPRPDRVFVPIRIISDYDEIFFRFFIDGSQRITNAGFVVDRKKRYLPILIAQTGVATTELRNSRLSVKHYDSTNTLYFPNSFAQEDLNEAKSIACAVARESRLELDLEFDKYEIDDTDATPPVDRARSQILQKMHAMEVNRIVRLAQADDLSRESLLLIDGSLQFYENMDRHKEAFRNVVGVAKSFDLHKSYLSSSNSEKVGALISRQPVTHRTPARGITHRNLTIASWYLRLHDRSRISSLDYPDGVVKIEVFPDNPGDDSAMLQSARCDRISEHVLALRAPATPNTDARWASHLYPVHLTERYIKSQFLSDRSIRACL